MFWVEDECVIRLRHVPLIADPEVFGRRKSAQNSRVLLYIMHSFILLFSLSTRARNASLDLVSQAKFTYLFPVVLFTRRLLLLMGGVGGRQNTSVLLFFQNVLFSR